MPRPRPARMRLWSNPLLRVLAATALAAALALSPLARATPAGTVTVADLPDIIAPLLDAVVNITVLKAPPPVAGATGAQQAAAWTAERSFGSGFIIDPAGYIVTNRHVVAGGFKVTVTLHDERQFPASVVATNARPDLALLKIDAPGDLATVGWGDSDALRLGETVIAIGNPLGLATSITVGIVSALNRNVRSTPIDDFIQTDTAINQGNSGGPLFNLKGEVVGVNWAIVTPTLQSGSVGLGLAIPSGTAAWALTQMRRQGRLIVGFPGFGLQPITREMADVLGLPDTSGGIINEAAPDGPALRAGLVEGDVVLQIGDRRAADARAMLRNLANYPPGSVVPIRVWRDGREWVLDLTMAPFPAEFDPAGPPAFAPSAFAPSAPPRPAPTLGLRLSPLDDATRQSFAVVQRRPGLVVEGVAAGTVGAELGLARGDLILRLGTTVVPSVDAFAAALARRPAGRAMLMQVQMQGGVKWIVLPPP